jgi:hypothetical protein
MLDSNLVGIFIDGKEIGWCHEAPKERVRETIQKAVEEGTKHSLWGLRNCAGVWLEW